jgi:hypothetical protein
MSTSKHGTGLVFVFGKFFFLIVCLLVCGAAMALPAPSRAEHKLLVDQCVDAQMTEQKTSNVTSGSTGNDDTSSAVNAVPQYARAFAQCEFLEREIDLASKDFDFGTLGSVEECCHADCKKADGTPVTHSGCGSAGAATHKLAHDEESSHALASQFAASWQPSRFAPFSTACDDATCLTTLRDPTSVDSIRFPQKLQTQRMLNADRIEDMIFPGFGRWERKTPGVDYRLDYLDPHRCHSRERVGICFSITLH